MEPRALLLLLPALFAAACDGLQIQSVQASTTVPRALQGEWTGTWASGSLDGQGPLTVLVQVFDGQPVLSIDVDNPCLVAGEYELTITGPALTLRRNGAITLAGVLGADHTLAGTFQCPADTGTWQATWVRNLPPIVDLGGVWSGSVASAARPQTNLELQLAQSVRSGLLALDGTLALPELLPGPVAITGSARFHDDVFDLVLTTPAGVAPALQLVGVGDPAALTLRDGLLVTGGSPLPFVQAAWQMQWARP